MSSTGRYFVGGARLGGWGDTGPGRLCDENPNHYKSSPTYVFYSAELTLYLDGEKGTSRQALEANDSDKELAAM
jgi:hypothetical protein